MSWESLRISCSSCLASHFEANSICSCWWLVAHHLAPHRSLEQRPAAGAEELQDLLPHLWTAFTHPGLPTWLLEAFRCL